MSLIIRIKVHITWIIIMPLYVDTVSRSKIGIIIQGIAILFPISVLLYDTFIESAYFSAYCICMYLSI